MHKQRTLLLIIVSFFTAFVCAWYPTDIRFAVGPSWHAFLDFQTDDIIPSMRELIPSVEGHKSPLLLMPYIEGRLSQQLPCCFSLNVLAGAAGSNHGRLAITSSQFILPGLYLAGKREAFAQISILFGDINIAGNVCINRLGLTLNPMVGYVGNREKIFNDLVNDPGNVFTFYNKWYGPYVGLSGSVQPLEQVKLTTSYKFVPGKMKNTIEAFYTNEALLALAPNTAVSKRFAPMFGNIFSGEVAYTINPCWQTGINVMYFNYKVRCTTPICLGPTTTILSAQLERFQWQQFMVTLFAQYQF